MVTIDSNVAIYAFLDAGPKARTANGLIAQADFISAQVLNEFASVASRRHRRPWPEIASKVADLRTAVGNVIAVGDSATAEAIRIADRYRLAFYDALIIAVALSGGARTLYSEDMHHGLMVEDTLRIVDPFR